MEHYSDLISESANYDLGRHNNIYYLKRVVETNCKSLIESQSKTKETSQILSCQSQLNNLFIEYMGLVMKSDEVFSSAVLRPRMLAHDFAESAAAGEPACNTTTTTTTANINRDLILLGSVVAAAIAYFTCVCKVRVM